VCTAALVRDTGRLRTRVVTRIALGASKRIAPLPHRPHFGIVVRFGRPIEVVLLPLCARWVDATPRASRRAGARRPQPGRARAREPRPARARVGAALGLAGARVAPDPAAVYRARDAVCGRPSRHRHCRERRGLRTGGWRRALLRVRRRPERAVDRASWWHPLELRTRAFVAVGWRCRHARRSDRDARTRPLRRAVPALRSTHRRSLRFADAVSGRHPALGPAADPASFG
jgi:hypothetical protein